jgi:hypothetical protein
MAMNGLQPMPLFEPKADPTNTSARWTQWIQRFKRLSLQKRTDQNLIKNRFRLNFTRKYKNVSTLTNSYRFFKFLDSSRDFMMYVSTTKHVKMSAIFRTLVVQFRRSITYT